MHTVFAIDRELRPTEAAVYGVISLVFWAITLVVTVKYVILILRADNHGEGGIMALIALVRGIRVDRRLTKLVLVSLGIFGAALFYGDGMITPAISVLSAVEGLEVAAPDVDSLVVPITLAIVTVLFAVQRFGTGVVGRAFGPVMALWFGILAVSGLVHVLEEPGILRALSPHYGGAFLFEHGAVGFLALGAVVLAVTGAEALYADMGHFGRHAIRRAWLFVVFPALTLNYMGQGTLILGDPSAVDNPFFLLFPGWLQMPMVVVATVAAVIASQAVISGAFSVTRQAVQLGFLPQLTVLHTSREIGQVYVPLVNWVIFTAVAALVVGFGSSDHLASAYGIAVTGTLAIDTLLFFFVVRALWHKPKWLAVAGCVFFLVIDLAFFGANLPKVLHGGWFPLVIAAIDLRRPRHVAERAGDRAGAPAQARGAAAAVRRGGARARRRDPRAAHGRVLRRLCREHAARAAREPRAQPHGPRDGRGRLAGAAQRPARAGRQAPRARRARLRGRRHLPRHRALRLPGRHRHPGAPARGARAARGRRRPRAGLLLRLARHHRRDRRPVHGPLGARSCSRRSRATPPPPSATSTCPTSGPS